MNQRKRKTVVKGSRHENHACAHDHFNDFISTSIIGKENYRITKSLESLHIMMTPDQWAVQFSQSSTRKHLFEKKVIILDLFNYILTNCLLPSLKRHSVAMKKSFMHNFQHEINLQFCYLVTVWSMLHVTQFVETQDRAFYYQSCMSWFRIMISKILLT